MGIIKRGEIIGYTSDSRLYQKGSSTIMITITGFDILRVFPGAQNVVIDKPLFCCHCDGDSIGEYDRLYATASTKDVVTLLAKRQSKIVRRKWPDGRSDWMCTYCSREAKVN